MLDRFCRFELRTTDADAARAFYAQIFGHDRSVVWPLHEQALARGAPAHWLGHLAVDDVERAQAAWLERGAQSLGPVRPTSTGGRAAVVRDAGGAVVAVATLPPADAPGHLDVPWQVLNTADAPRAIATYRELFGLEVRARREQAGLGAFHLFAWRGAEAHAGAIADIAGRPGVHAHWLFFFRVAALDRALATTRSAGGKALDPIGLLDGRRVGVCEDPQGGAFGLVEA